MKNFTVFILQQFMIFTTSI